MQRKTPIIGIIGGRGKMGQWFTKFFQEQKLTVLVAGRKTPLSIKQLVKKVDIVIVSVPISETQKVIKKIIPYLQKESLLTDLTSFKVMPLEAMKESPSGALGMHPLFGPSATIDQGLRIVFCKQKDNQYVTFLHNLFTKTGIEILTTSPEEHDYQMAYIQAFTHAVNLLYAKIIFEQKNVLLNKLHTPIFTLQSLSMGRVLHQDIKLLADIQLYNPYFLPVLEAFVEQGKKLEKIIETEDKKAFIEMFRQEQELAKNFASFSTQQTNKLLQQVNKVHLTIPTKVPYVKLGRNAKIAYLGPEGTFSNQAALILFPEKLQKKIAYETLFDVFKAVQNNDVDVAVVPAENSIEGSVRETLDYLIEFSLSVSGSFDLPIYQQLLSTERALSAIHSIVSHPQALAQCKHWIQTNLPTAKLIFYASTTTGLQHPQKGHAYVASLLAAKKYGVQILAKNIEDNTINKTKFYIIAKKKMHIDESSSNKILLFLSVHNRVGVLRDILDVFAKYNINLTKLESRPSGRTTWDYHFFVEFEKPSSTSVTNVLTDIQVYCPIIQVLGKT